MGLWYFANKGTEHCCSSFLPSSHRCSRSKKLHVVTLQKSLQKTSRRWSKEQVDGWLMTDQPQRSAWLRLGGSRQFDEWLRWKSHRSVIAARQCRVWLALQWFDFHADPIHRCLTHLKCVYYSAAGCRSSPPVLLRRPRRSETLGDQPADICSDLPHGVTSVLVFFAPPGTESLNWCWWRLHCPLLRFCHFIKKKKKIF